MPKATNYTERLLRGKHEHRRDRVWQAMRIMRRFEFTDLLATCELPSKSRASVQTFLKYLRRAGFVAVKRGNIGRHERVQYTLVRNSGPKCPSIIRKGTQVWDRNDDTLHPVAGGAS